METQNDVNVSTPTEKKVLAPAKTQTPTPVIPNRGKSHFTLTGIRKGKGLSVQEMAVKMGTDTAEVLRFEEEPENFPVVTWHKYAGALGADVELMLIFPQSLCIRVV